MKKLKDKLKLAIFCLSLSITVVGTPCLLLAYPAYLCNYLSLIELTAIAIPTVISIITAAVMSLLFWREERNE